MTAIETRIPRIDPIVQRAITPVFDVIARVELVTGQQCVKAGNWLTKFGRKLERAAKPAKAPLAARPAAPMHKAVPAH
ncbi:MAG TPA: hypothetical protein VLW85_10375 [Myxococcales bacterium]|nr:hypothetical protein [Myxococcales bacterium]